MAKGRMLSRDIASDEDIRKLSDDSYIVYVSMIPFIDREGRFFANPGVIKGYCLPYRDRFTLKKIEKCLLEIEKNNIIRIYGDNWEYSYFKGFLKHNKVHPNEAASVIPSYDSKWMEKRLTFRKANGLV